MEKKEGDPQAIAFQVPDPSAQDSEDAATVTVKTRQLADAAGFAAAVQQEFERAKEQPGFATDPANKDAAVRQYMETTRPFRGDVPEYNVRIANYVYWTLQPHSAVVARCLRRWVFTAL